MNQMWVEIGLNAFQINCSDDSRYANDQYHIFWQFRSYTSNANMAKVIWHLTLACYMAFLINYMFLLKHSYSY